MNASVCVDVTDRDRSEELDESHLDTVSALVLSSFLHSYWPRQTASSPTSDSLQCYCVVVHGTTLKVFIDIRRSVEPCFLSSSELAHRTMITALKRHCECIAISMAASDDLAQAYNARASERLTHS